MPKGLAEESWEGKQRGEHAVLDVSNFGGGMFHILFICSSIYTITLLLFFMSLAKSLSEELLEGGQEGEDALLSGRG